MFNDDFFDGEDMQPLDVLLRKYEQIKNGEANYILDEDEFVQVIDYYMQEGQEEGALLACEIAYTYYPYSATILFFKAQILTQAQKYGQALKTLDEMEQFDAVNADAVILRSDIYLGQLKYDQAAAHLESRVEDFDKKEKVEILLELSDVYDECEEFDAVFDTLRRVVTIDKRNEEALQKLCFWADFTKRLEESIEIHTHITDEDPYNALAWFNLGAAYQGLKLYEKAIDAYEYCIAIDDKFEFAYRNMADAFMRTKNFKKALEVLEKHLEIAKPEDVIFEAMGYCWEKIKNFAQARFYYRQAVQLNPKDDSIFFKIGETYKQEQQWEKAAKSYSTAITLDKENATYCIAMGNCLLELGVHQEALICFLNAVQLKPNNKTAWVALIKGLILSKYFEEALTQIDIAKEHCGDKIDFEYYHAATLIELGKSKEGLLVLENALKMQAGKVKIFTELNPDFLRRQSVVDLISKYKKK